jgi:cell division protein FtsL
MSKIRTVITALIVAMLFVSAIAGTVVYYNTAVNNKNSKITSLQSQISNQNREIANLTTQIAVQPDLSKSHVITELGVIELETD